MSTLKNIFLLPIFVLGCVCNLCNATDVINLDKQNLGIQWNVTATALKNKFPDISPMVASGVTVRGTVSIGSLFYRDDAAVLSFDEKGNLNKVSTGISSADSITFINTFNSKFGDGRWVASPAEKTFLHLWEWRGTGFTVEFQYTSESASKLAQPTKSGDAVLIVWRDRPSQTRIDTALAQLKALEELRKKYPQGVKKQ